MRAILSALPPRARGGNDAKIARRRGATLRVAATNLREHYLDALTARGAAIRCSLMGFVRRLHRISAPAGFAYGSLLVLAGCSQSEDRTCRPSRGVIVVAVAPQLAASRVSTSGKCGPAECVQPADAGCVQWESPMPTKDPQDECHVRIELPDGSLQQHLVFGGQQCGEPVGKRIEVSSN